jgi:hypothetical protein
VHYHKGAMCEKAEVTQQTRVIYAVEKFPYEVSEAGFGVPLLCLFGILGNTITLFIHHCQGCL